MTSADRRNALALGIAACMAVLAVILLAGAYVVVEQRTRLTELGRRANEASAADARVLVDLELTRLFICELPVDPAEQPDLAASLDRLCAQPPLIDLDEALSTIEEDR